MVYLPSFNDISPPPIPYPNFKPINVVKYRVTVITSMMGGLLKVNDTQKEIKWVINKVDLGLFTKNRCPRFLVSWNTMKMRCSNIVFMFT